MYGWKHMDFHTDGASFFAFGPPATGAPLLESSAPAGRARVHVPALRGDASERKARPATRDVDATVRAPSGRHCYRHAAMALRSALGRTPHVLDRG